ncbi:MAG: energy transducer TonB, partial [Pyrinomonadaceae bacterium]
MKVFRLLLIAAVLASMASLSPVLSHDGLDNPTVVQTVPPSYPLIARAANVSGVVIVEVSIDAGGSVTAVKVLEGHKLLNLIAKKSARKWKFNALDKAKERSAQL